MIEVLSDQTFLVKCENFWIIAMENVSLAGTFLPSPTWKLTALSTWPKTRRPSRSMKSILSSFSGTSQSNAMCWRTREWNRAMKMNSNSSAKKRLNKARFKNHAAIAITLHANFLHIRELLLTTPCKPLSDITMNYLPLKLFKSFFSQQTFRVMTSLSFEKWVRKWKSWWKRTRPSEIRSSRSMTRGSNCSQTSPTTFPSWAISPSSFWRTTNSPK